jgi:hypothetical protein
VTEIQSTSADSRSGARSWCGAKATLAALSFCLLLASGSATSAANLNDGEAAISQDNQSTSSSSSTGQTGGKSNVLHGAAEVSAMRDNLKAWQASKMYEQGAMALDAKNLRLAAECFRRAAPGFDQPGYEKFEAQTKFAEAQSRRLLGQKKDSAKLYQAAIDLFNEYDPLSPYLKAALDNLPKVAPELKGKAAMDKARLQALVIPSRIMRVDRNVMLKGGLSEYGSKLLAQKALVDVPSAYVKEVQHKAFIKMTCLETTDLGSNYITGANIWYPLISNGKTVAIAASSSFMVPTISVRINERPYNVGVDLPGIGTNKRTVFLLTDGCHIIAIDPNTEDMWNLDSDFKDQASPKFTWRKLLHFKPKPKIKP